MGTWYAAQGLSGHEEKSPSVRDGGRPGDEGSKLTTPEGPGRVQPRNVGAWGREEGTYPHPTLASHTPDPRDPSCFHSCLITTGLTSLQGQAKPPATRSPYAHNTLRRGSSSPRR